MNFPAIYLASTSPRRRELLTQIGVDFSVINIDIDECMTRQESPGDYVKRIALAKAMAGWNMLKAGRRPVLAADTAVVLKTGQVLGKPENLQQAREYLQQLSATSHQVMSAVAIVWERQHWVVLQTNEVHFKQLTEAEIAWYLATGEGVDKAGGYAVQGLAAMFIKSIKGSYSGVMGLPLFETSQLLQQVNIANEQ